MNLFDRFILTLYSLALTILSVIAIAVFMRLISLELIQLNLQVIYEFDQPRYAYLAVSVIFFLISLKFLLQGFRRSKGHESATVISQTTDIGHVTISLNTIESIALKAARRIRGVRDVKSVVKANETGTSIVLKAAVDGETPIQGIIDEIQKAVKHQIEKIVGIEIKEVDVLITEVAQQQLTPRLSRVE
ncbi:MAG TPA: alkaline shock response membrane anchor protein AmaP [Bacillota bacterium]|nr:alkaline shock response membrane anchor protein AmaP [Bacillota bacterium]